MFVGRVEDLTTEASSMIRQYEGLRGSTVEAVVTGPIGLTPLEFAALMAHGTNTTTLV